MTDINAFVHRYVAVWNEPDTAARRRLVAELWAADSVEIRPGFEHRGHVAIEERVTGAYQDLVRDKGFVFRAAGEVLAHHDAVSFRTEMVPAGGGDVAWAGEMFVQLDEHGRILRDYQFTRDPDPVVVRQRETRAVLDELLRRRAEGTPEEFAELFADEIDWQVPGSERVPWIRPRSAPADMAEFLRTMRKHLDWAKATATEPTILVDGADAVAMAAVTQTVIESGRGFGIPIALHITVVDGRITRYHVYEDSLTVAEAFA